MNKHFIPYELALALRELGFNEECLCFYYTNDKLELLISNDYKDVVSLPLKDTQKFTNSKNRNDYVVVPTWSQVFDWIEEKYDLFASFDKVDNSRNFYYDFMIVDSKDRDYNDEDLFDSASRKLDKGKYKIKEEARQACLIKLIELCKKN